MIRISLPHVIAIIGIHTIGITSRLIGIVTWPIRKMTFTFKMMFIQPIIIFQQISIVTQFM